MMNDRQYYLQMARDRIELLQKRYKIFCTGVDERGRELTYSTAAGFRHVTKRDIGLLMLVEELLAAYKGTMMLSDQAQSALDHLTDPNERR
jgi:hypothetical protein